jgi:DNA polymerase, archaea type
MIKLLIIDADYDYDNDNSVIIRLYGKNIIDSTDCVLYVHGFDPYIYIDNCGHVVNELARVVENVLRGYVKRIDIVYRFRPIGYQRVKTEMLKVILFNPKTVPEIREILVEQIERVTPDMIYEADIPFRDRFLVDMGIDGMSVISFEDKGNEIKNYSMGCSNLYSVDISEISKCEEEKVKIDY